MVINGGFAGLCPAGSEFNGKIVQCDCNYGKQFEYFCPQEWVDVVSTFLKRPALTNVLLREP